MRLPFRHYQGGQHAPVRIALISHRGSASAGMAGVSVDLSNIPMRYSNRFGGVNMLRNIQFKGMPTFQQYFKISEHPFKPTEDRYFYMRGLPSITTAYNANGGKVSETLYNYLPLESTRLQSFKSTRVKGSSTSFSDQFYLYVYSVNCGKPQLISRLDRNYNPDQSFSEVKREFTYNPLNDQIQKEKTTTSKGDVLENYYTYTCDHDDGLMNGNIFQMKTKNIINPIVSKRTVLNDIFLTDVSVLIYNQYGKITETYAFNCNLPSFY